MEGFETEFELVLALAGYDQEDIEITTKENHLYVSSTQNKEDQEKVEYLYQGIAKRDFKFKMMLHEYTKVIGAKMKNGMLVISLENVVPEEKLPKKIEIK